MFVLICDFVCNSPWWRQIRSFLCNFSVFCLLLTFGSHILTTLFLHALNVRFSSRMRDQLPYLYETTYEVTVLYILMFTLFGQQMGSPNILNWRVIGNKHFYKFIRRHILRKCVCFFCKSNFNAVFQIRFYCFVLETGCWHVYLSVLDWNLHRPCMW
jgi:hypothetical protein